MILLSRCPFKPLILEKANNWTAEPMECWSVKARHSPLDAVYFLVKEKCDVLLQNVRRRIRKRKRFLQGA